MSTLTSHQNYLHSLILHRIAKRIIGGDLSSGEIFRRRPPCKDARIRGLTGGYSQKGRQFEILSMCQHQTLPKEKKTDADSDRRTVRTSG